MLNSDCIWKNIKPLEIAKIDIYIVKYFHLILLLLYQNKRIKKEKNTTTDVEDLTKICDKMQTMMSISTLNLYFPCLRHIKDNDSNGNVKYTVLFAWPIKVNILSDSKL